MNKNAALARVVMMMVLLSGCFPSSDLEEKLKKFMWTQDHATVLPLSQLMPEQTDLTYVCVLGPYQRRIDQYSRRIEKGPSPSIEKINKFLSDEEFTGSEHKWYLVLLNDRGVVRYVEVNRYKVPIIMALVGDAGWGNDSGRKPLACADFSKAAFAKFHNRDNQKALGFINLEDDNQMHRRSG